MKCPNCKKTLTEYGWKIQCQHCGYEKMNKEKVKIGTMKKKKMCIRCKKRKPIPYEPIGRGQFCQKCMEKEWKEYYAEGGI